VRCAGASVARCTFAGNTALYNGGLYVGAYDNAGRYWAGAGSATVSNSVFTDNMATDSYGGGIYTDGGITVKDSDISGNTAFCGGGIATGDMSGAVTVTGGKLDGNTATVSVTDADVRQMADEYGLDFDMVSAWYGGGGGLYTGATASISATEIAGNTSGRYGGGIYSNGAVILSGAVISGNRGDINGGGIFGDTGGSISVSGGAVKGTSRRLETAAGSMACRASRCPAARKSTGTRRRTATPAACLSARCLA